MRKGASAGGFRQTPDGMRLDQVQWIGATIDCYANHTQTTDVPVPYAWLNAKCSDVVDEYDSYEKVSKQTALNGRLTVEQCYVAGVNPESATNDFRVLIGPDLKIDWDPNLKGARNYAIWGSETIEGGGDWHWPTNALDRFFKVTVEMPQ